MSLNWSLEKIENSDDLCWHPAKPGEKDEDRQMKAMTNAIIWATMSVDLGRITEKNYLDFFARCQLVSRLFGAPLVSHVDGKREDVDFTIADIKAHIGLSTNVSDKSAAAFAKRQTEAFLRGQISRATSEIASK